MSLEPLAKAAAANHGITLAPVQVREILKLIMSIDNMLAAYMNEFGEGLANALLGVVEAEVVDDKDKEEIRSTSQDDGLESSLEEQEQRPLSETLGFE